MNSSTAMVVRRDHFDYEMLMDVAVTPPARVADLLEALEESVAAADEATRSAVAVRREIAELLRAEGLPMRDVGELIGVSHQRVSQLLAS